MLLANMSPIASEGLTITRTPADGKLTISDSKADAVLSCALEKGNSLVSDWQWLHKDKGDQEWEVVENVSGKSLSPRNILDDKEEEGEHEFRCQMGSDFADFVVHMNGTADSESVTKRHRRFRVQKFELSYAVDDGEDFVKKCDVDFRDDALTKDQIGYKWFKWTETNDFTFNPKAEHTKTNCDITQQNSNWIEITGKEKEGADDLEVHFQIFQDHTLKIEDARMQDRRGFKCIAYNKSSESVCSESMFFLRVKDKMAALYPSVGIVVELIVLVVIIFACEKAKGPSSSGDDDDEYNGNAVGRSDSSVRHRRT